MIAELDPIFDDTPLNLTVTAGKTAVLPCTVENLGQHKVNLPSNKWEECLIVFGNLKLKGRLNRPGGFEKLIISVLLHPPPFMFTSRDGCMLAAPDNAIWTHHSYMRELNSSVKQIIFNDILCIIQIFRIWLIYIWWFKIYVNKNNSNCFKTQMTWMHPKRVLISMDDRRVIDDTRMSIERPFVRDWNLHIRHIRYNDSGEYRCTINTYPVQVKRIKLSVQGKSCSGWYICFLISLIADSG